MAMFGGDWAKVKEALIEGKAGPKAKIKQRNIRKEGLINLQQGLFPV